MPILALHGIFAGYGQADIVRGIDLELEEGTITCVVGPNGAGKSTVLKTLSGLLRPRLGTITLNGKEAKLTDLKKGDKIKVTMGADKKVSKIEARRS